MSEGKVMYRTWLRDIEKFTVVRETESTVFFINDRGKNDLDMEQTESVKHFIKALRTGCGCDDYNGFDCGCGHRAFLCNEALKELDNSSCH